MANTNGQRGRAQNAGWFEVTPFQCEWCPVAILYTWSLHTGTSSLSDGHAGSRTHPRNLPRERIVPAQEPGTRYREVGVRCRLGCT